MKTRVLVASLVALAFAIPAANALTIVNGETSDVTVKVFPKGGKEINVAIKAGTKADVDCKMGCKLELGKVTEAVDGKLVTITVKDGKFVM